MERRQYAKLLDDCDDSQYIASQLIASLSKAELGFRYGIDQGLPEGALPRPGHMPLSWRKNPGYDSKGRLVCAGCGKAMAVGQSKDGHDHAACATAGCELYGRDYISASEARNPHAHRAETFDPDTGRYKCGCGVLL